MNKPSSFSPILGRREPEVPGAHCGGEGVRFRVCQVAQRVRHHDPVQGTLRGGPHHYQRRRAGAVHAPTLHRK